MFQHLSQWLKNQTAKKSRRERRKGTQGKSSHRPRIESLEDRIAPATRVWDGGGANANWTTAANWVGDTAPSAGDALVFPGGASQVVNNNDFGAATSFGSITFYGSGYDITGNSITLGAGGSIAAYNSLGTNRLQVQIATFAGAATITTTYVGTTLELSNLGTWAVGANALAVGGSGTTILRGALSVGATGSLTKNDPGTLILVSASNCVGIRIDFLFCQL